MAASDLTWHASKLDELTVNSLYDIMQLRANVFIVEQACVYLDLDGLDKNCHHVYGTKDDSIVAYARVIPPLTKDSNQVRPEIGRVVIAPNSRGGGIARVLMQQAINICTSTWPDKGIKIGAQAHLEKFYSSLGFKKISEPYDEDGIMHIDMIRS